MQQAHNTPTIEFLQNVGIGIAGTSVIFVCFNLGKITLYLVLSSFGRLISDKETVKQISQHCVLVIHIDKSDVEIFLL